MARKKQATIENPTQHRKALSMESRENQLIALSYDLVEQRLREGTASAMETVHFLRMGSPKERKSIELMEKQMNVLDKKAEAYETSKRMESLYADAIAAVNRYRSSVPKTGESIND